MGMGHAVYKTTDPRSEVLATLSRAISKEKDTKWYEIDRKSRTRNKTNNDGEAGK